jgi:5-methylcytosine-specific restriction endonuclease McrA
MADLWNLIFWLLFASAPIYLIIWYFNSEEKGEKTRQAQTRISRLRKEPMGRRKPNEPFSKEQRKIVLSYTEEKCFYCCKDLSLNYWEIEHLWPLKLGGVNELFNLVASCKECNRQKFIYNPFTWMVTKWHEQGNLNEFELRFLKYYSVHSPSNLTNNKFWESYMKKIPNNVIGFRKAMDEAVDKKKRDEVYQKYIRIFSDRPEKFEITDK